MATFTPNLGLRKPVPGDEMDPDLDIGNNMDLLDSAAMANGINIRHLGASGNGIDDDTEAIQTGLDVAYAAGGGVVIIPPGTYRLTTYLTVRTGTTIIAYGAKLVGAGTHSLLRNFSLEGIPDSFPGYGGHGRITVLGGIWDNNGQTSAIEEMNNCVTMNHGHDITFRDMEVRNVAGYHAYEINSTDRVVIHNCHAFGFVDNSNDASRTLSEAFQIDVSAVGSSTIGDFDNTPARNVVISACSAGPAVDGSGLGTWGALAGSHSTPIGGFYQNIQVVNCTLWHGSLRYAVHAEAWKDSLISGCTFVDTGQTAILAEGAGAGSGLRIIGNVIRNSGSNAINLTNQSGVLIEGNSIIGTVSNHGVFLSASTRCIMRGNRVENAASAAFRLSGASTGWFISGNQIVKGASTNAFSMVAAATGGILVGNDMRGEGYTVTTWINSGADPFGAAPRISHAGAVPANPSASSGDNWL